jgi:hypothetical protein
LGTYCDELNDRSVNLIRSGVGIERSHQASEDPVAELGFGDGLFCLLCLEELDNLTNKHGSSYTCDSTDLFIRLFVIDHPGDIENSLVLDFEQSELVVPIENGRQVFVLEMFFEVLPVPCLDGE